MKVWILSAFMLILCGYDAGVDQAKSMQSDLDGWKSFYRRNFGLQLNLSNLSIPEHLDEYDRLIVVAEGISYEKLITTMRGYFDVVFVNKYLPNYFDNNLTNARNNSKTYAIRIRDRIESGELEQGSAAIEKVVPGNKPGLPLINDITLMERLLYEMKYFEETGQHLDLETFTVCAGSHFKRDSLALSPAVGWKQGIDAYFTPYLYISECYDIYTIDGMYSRNVIVNK